MNSFTPEFKSFFLKSSIHWGSLFFIDNLSQNFIIFSTLPSSSTLRLSDDKLAVTRRQGIDANTRNICSKDRINDYVTICPQFNTDQFIVIQVAND